MVAVIAPLLSFGGRCVMGGSFLVFPDAQNQTYPWMQKLSHAVHGGLLPMWDANSLSGHSFVGELQAGAFYPPNLLWAGMLANANGVAAPAIDALILLHFVLASLGMFRLLRDWELPAGAATFGAVVFSCLGPVALRAPGQANIFFGLCWMPWGLHFLWRHLTRGTWHDGVLAGASMGLQIVAGHGQPSLHTALLCAAMTVRGSGSIGQLVRAALWVAGGVLVIATPQLYLSAQYLADAYRWVSADAPIGPGERVPFDVFTHKFVWEPSAWRSVFDPWGHGIDDANTLFVGVATLPLVIWFLSVPSARRAVPAFAIHGGWLLGIGLFALAAAVGKSSPVAALLYQVPVLNQVRELGRYMVLVHFAVAALAAMAMAAVAQLPRPRPVIITLTLAGGLVLAGWLCTSSDRSISRTATLQLWVALLPTTAFVLPMLRPLLPLVLAGALATDVCAFGSLVVPRPAPGARVEERFARNPITTALDATYGSARVDIRDTSLPANYADAHYFQQKMGHGATMSRPFFDFLQVDWSETGRVNDLLNVRYILTSTDRPYRLVLEDATRKLRLYERPTWYPRVFLASQVSERPDGAAIAAALQLTVEHYDDHRQRFHLQVPAADTAIAAELVYPGWCATVNDRPTPIEPATLGTLRTPLRAVAVPAGEVVLEFTYHPLRRALFGCP